MLILLASISSLASFILAYPVRLVILRIGMVDEPNGRSSHILPTPRGGGIAVLLGSAAALAHLNLIPLTLRTTLIILAVGSIACISLWDDFRSLSFKSRLFVQTVAATVLVGALRLEVTTVDFGHYSCSVPAPLGICSTILFIVGFCNFFNFMDGINGLAAGQGAASAAALAAILYRAGLVLPAACAAALSGGCLGFVPHNFPRARIFLGDVGSVTIGFVLAILTAVGHAHGGISWTALLLVHLVFVFDPLITLVKRLGRGESLVQPHREHSYQLLVRSGWSHTKTTLAFWLATLCCCAASGAYLWSPDFIQQVIVMCLLAMLTAGATAIHRHVTRRTIGASGIPSKAISG